MKWKLQGNHIYRHSLQATKKVWSGIVSILSTNTKLVISGKTQKSSVKKSKTSKSANTTSSPYRAVRVARSAISAFTVSLKSLMENLLIRAKR